MESQRSNWVQRALIINALQVGKAAEVNDRRSGKTLRDRCDRTFLCSRFLHNYLLLYLRLLLLRIGLHYLCKLVLHGRWNCWPDVIGIPGSCLLLLLAEALRRTLALAVRHRADVQRANA